MDLGAARDVIIIIVALVTLAANVLLIVVGLRIWGLIKATKAEIDPILASVQRTTDTVKGTTTVVGDVIVGPVAKLAATAAATQTLLRSVTTISRGGRR